MTGLAADAFSLFSLTSTPSHGLNQRHHETVELNGCVSSLLEADFFFIKWQQQQNTPAGQKADILQQEHQPGSLVADVDHGGELEGGRGELEVKVAIDDCIRSVYHKPRLDITIRSTWKWGLSRPKLLMEEVQKVERESDGNRGKTNTVRWRASALCWHVSSYHRELRRFCFKPNHTTGFSTLPFHSTEIGVSWSNGDSYFCFG